MSKKSHNLWVVDGPNTITGLVHPETRKEAEAEMKRLGITGTLLPRKSFEKTNKYKAMLLNDQRAHCRIAIIAYANTMLDNKFPLMREIGKMAANLKPAIQGKMRIVDYAESRIEWCKTASSLDILNYNPSLDSNWPT